MKIMKMALQMTFIYIYLAASLTLSQGLVSGVKLAIGIFHAANYVIATFVVPLMRYVTAVHHAVFAKLVILYCFL